jgi:hypothetical protein
MGPTYTKPTFVSADALPLKAMPVASNNENNVFLSISSLLLNESEQ